MQFYPYQNYYKSASKVLKSFQERTPENKKTHHKLCFFTALH